MENTAEIEAKSIGIAMLEVSKRLLSMRPDQLGMMMHEAHALMRSSIESERSVGSLLRLQVMEALASKVL